MLSTAINRHMFLTGRRMFDARETLLKYSKTELVESVEEIQHPIFREALQLFKLSGLDIGVSSDIPSGSGLGSSSTFTVALVSLLSEMVGDKITKKRIAELACTIELERLQEPIGKQDQYASAMGGMNLITFNEDNTVEVRPLLLSAADQSYLDHTLLLVQLPEPPRAASAVLTRMAAFQKSSNSATGATRELAQLARRGFVDIQTNGIRVLPDLLNEGWDLKKRANPIESMEVAREMMELGLKSGALGGKLLGAGSGGFLLFVVPLENQEKFYRSLSTVRILKIRPDLDGVTTIYREENK